MLGQHKGVVWKPAVFTVCHDDSTKYFTSYERMLRLELLGMLGMQLVLLINLYIFYLFYTVYILIKTDSFPPKPKERFSPEEILYTIL